MTAITPAALTVSVATATGTFLLTEAGVATIPWWTLLMPTISGVISLIVTVVVLKAKTDHLQKAADEFRREMREDLREIYSLMRDTSERVARLEGES
jgi:hypothetical protein